MDDANDEVSLGGTEAEIKELLGLFDIPAYARRGQDVEYALLSLDRRCLRERGEMLAMVRLRLRQWAAIATGPDAALAVFARPIDDLWPLADAPPPSWAARSASAWRLRSAGRDLVASVERFNRRWAAFLDETDLEPVNRLVERYNRYYILEKECALGSPRLASRHFEPKPNLSRADLLARHQTLPVPEPRRGSRP